MRGGYHVYKDVWQPRLDEILTTRQQLGNPEDRHAVTVIKLLYIDGNEELIVGRVTREISIGHVGTSCRMTTRSHARLLVSEDGHHFNKQV